MDLDVIDLERGGPHVVLERGEVVVVPAATEFTWKQVASAVIDVHYFATMVWPVDRALTAWKLEHAHQGWCRHNGLTDRDETRQLIHLLERYYEGIEYDLRSRLGVSLGELWRSRRWRELVGYIQQLPADTRLNALLANDEEHLEAAIKAREKRAPNDSGLGGPSMADWSQPVAMMADLIDAVNRNTEVTRAAAGGKPSRVQPYPRPRTAAERVSNRVRQAEHEQMASVLLRNRPNPAGTIQGTPSTAE